MILYHGTSGANVETILREGLRPRGRRPGNWELESRWDSVYLTNIYAPYYAIAAIDEDDCPPEMAVFEVAVDEQCLYPDEDFLEQASRGKDVCPLTEKSERTLWYRDRLHGFGHHWKDSLEYLGTVSHYGAIPVEAICRVATSKMNRHHWVVGEMANPTITLWNKRLCGTRYRMLTRVCMGDDYSIDDFFFYQKQLDAVTNPEEKNELAKVLRQTEDDKQKLKTAIEAFRADVVVRDLQQERES